MALRACFSSSPWPRLSQAVFFLVWFLPGRINWRPPSGCRFFVSLAASFSSCFLPCLVPSGAYRLANDCLVPGFAKRPRRTKARSPRAIPWERTLPWAAAILSQNAAAVPVRDDRGRGSVCARAAGASTSRGVGTSVTVRTPNACGRSAAGRRRGGRPGGVWMRRPEPSTPRRNVRAVSVANLRPNHRRHRKLWQRVVTQQKFFSTPLCARPGCHEPPLKSVGKPACFCGRACGQAVRRVRDRERKWRLRGTFKGRRVREQEYAAARARRSGPQHDTASATPPPMPPP